MATSSKTSKPAKTLKAPLSAPPRTRAKANAEVVVETKPKPKPLKTKSVVKQTTGADTQAKPVKTKATAKVKSTIPPISNEHRLRYIELAAFYIAERRGFGGGNTLEDWLQAEAEIDQLLLQGKINR